MTHEYLKMDLRREGLKMERPSMWNCQVSAFFDNKTEVIKPSDHKVGTGNNYIDSETQCYIDCQAHTNSQCNMEVPNPSESLCQIGYTSLNVPRGSLDSQTQFDSQTRHGKADIYDNGESFGIQTHIDNKNSTNDKARQNKRYVLIGHQLNHEHQGRSHDSNERYGHGLCKNQSYTSSQMHNDYYSFYTLNNSSRTQASVFFSFLNKVMELYLFLPIVALLSQIVVVSDASADIRIECLADRYRASSNQWQGYTLHNLGLPSLGALDFTLAFPKDIPLGSCCQKIQLRFTANSVKNIVATTPDNEGGYFIPNVEWTLCTTDTRLFNCYGYNDMSNKYSSEADPSQNAKTGMISSVKPLTGSWWFVMQHCLRPTSNSASYEVGTFGLSGMSAVSAPRYSGKIKITPLRSIHVPRVQVSSDLPCLIEGHVDTKEQWFGYLATMTVPQDSSISYHFLFKESEPSNEALLNVLFYSEADVMAFKDSDSCEKKVAVLGSQQNTHKVLPLSIGNTWSGCAVESVNGTPTYTCEGGRNVHETHTVYIAIANCERSLGLQVYYFFEFQNYESDCPTTEPLNSYAVSCHCLFRTLYVILIVVILYEYGQYR